MEDESIRRRRIKGPHHLNIPIDMVANVLDVDAVWVLLHALGEGFVGSLDLGKEGLNASKN